MTDADLRDLEHRVATVAARQLLLSAQLDDVRNMLVVVGHALADLAESGPKTA